MGATGDSRGRLPSLGLDGGGAVRRHLAMTIGCTARPSPTVSRFLAGDDDRFACPTQLSHLATISRGGRGSVDMTMSQWPSTLRMTTSA